MSIEKQANAVLFAFNNKFVAIKPQIKQAKINEIRKLTRKIELLKKKKGDEAQKAQNERKAHTIVEEIKIINKLKFNDIAIFSLENESSFEQIMKSKPNLSLNDRALARIATCKKLLSEMQKIKDGDAEWKKLVIQYKSRLEKRRNWREKQKLYKDIEAKLTVKDDQVNDLSDVEDQFEDDSDESSEDNEKPNEAETEIVKNTSKIENEQAKPKKNLKKSSQESIDITSHNQEEADLDSVTNNKGEEITDQVSDSEGDTFFRPVEMKKSSNYLNKLTVSSVETKQMFIKQINLDEMVELDEIPIDGPIEYSSNEVLNGKEQSKQIDAFFLSHDGKEQGEPSEEQRRRPIKRSNRYNYNDNDDNPQYTKRSHESSFINSLAFANRNANKRQNSNRMDKNEGIQKKKFNYDRPQRDNQRFDNGRENFNKNKLKGRDEPRKFLKSEEVKKPNIEDIANLHPSWIAKREQEQKLKMLKFEGKKVVFE